MITPTATGPDVVAFAESVRVALSDLPQEEIDDLTDGLEADLSERADDAAPDSGDFGDPARYADELRGAAGLPSRPTSARRSHWRNQALGEWAAALGAGIARNIRSTAFGSGLLDGLASLRPVWWVLRGWALYHLLVTLLFNVPFRFVPTFGPSSFVLLALVVVSVQWGRGRWLPLRWLRTVKKVVGVVAVAALLILVPAAIDSPAGATVYPDVADFRPSGLSLDGEPIGNIFAYGSDGEPLTEVQLFDDDGNPLDLIGGAARDRWLHQYDEDGTESVVVPSDSVQGRLGWNVYPLEEADAGDIDYELEPEGALDPDDVDPASPPFAEVQPLADRNRDAGAATSESPSPTPAPSASPSPSP